MILYELCRDGGAVGRAIAAQRAAELPRTGVHVSTVIDRILRDINPKQYAKEFSESQRVGYQETGNVVESILADGFRRRVADWEKPEPRTHRGLTGSPDGWSPRSRTIDEIKALWKSEKDFNSVIGDGRRTLDLLDLVRENLKLYGYLLQILTYAEMWDADRGRLTMFFVNGDYKPFPAPKWPPRVFTIRWSKRERRDNFNRMIQAAEDYGLLEAA